MIKDALTKLVDGNNLTEKEAYAVSLRSCKARRLNPKLPHTSWAFG